VTLTNEHGRHDFLRTYLPGAERNHQTGQHDLTNSPNLHLSSCCKKAPEFSSRRSMKISGPPASISLSGHSKDTLSARLIEFQNLVKKIVLFL
jgi:hypothetical protein